MENLSLNNEKLKPKIDPNDLEWVTCGCPQNSTLFDSAVMLKKVPSIISGKPNPEFLNVEVLICKKCGKIPDFFKEISHIKFPEDDKLIILS